MPSRNTLASALTSEKVQTHIPSLRPKQSISLGIVLVTNTAISAPVLRMSFLNFFTAFLSEIISHQLNAVGTFNSFSNFGNNIERESVAQHIFQGCFLY